LRNNEQTGKQNTVWPNNDKNFQQQTLTVGINNVFIIQISSASVDQSNKKTSNSCYHFQNKTRHESCAKYAAIMKVSETEAFFVKTSAFVSGVGN